MQGADQSSLLAIDASSANDIRAVGYVIGNRTRTLTMHDDGTRRPIVPSPNARGSRTVSNLNAATVMAAEDAWAVGRAGDFTCVKRWNGSQWFTVPSANGKPVANPKRSDDNMLLALAGVAADHAWSVGDYWTADGRQRTLVLRYGCE